MKLALKFNLVLIFVLSLGAAATGYFSWEILQRNARQEIIDRAGIMMESATAMRSYTVKEIRPLLELQNKRNFLKQTVPAYAATKTFDKLREKHPEYAYKEATLNPTNPRDRAVAWEADLVQQFSDHPDKKEIFGERDTATGRSLYFARPIRITNPACLVCHSVPDAAPKTMVDQYGTANGFGWKLNEVVGTQVISVPMEVPIRHAKQAFITFMSALGGVFLFVIITLNVMLRAIVIKPVTRMAKIADDISMGTMDAPEFAEQGRDEITVLGRSFNRMRRSLEKAMKMLED